MASGALRAELQAGKCPNCGVKHRSLTPDECEDRSMSEKTLQDRVIGRAKRKGWVVQHLGRGIATFDSKGDPMFLTTGVPGWPDLFLLRPPRAMAIELKREQGEVSDEQDAMLRLFNACRIPAMVVRPSDLRAGRVTAILA